MLRHTRIETVEESIRRVPETSSVAGLSPLETPSEAAEEEEEEEEEEEGLFKADAVNEEEEEEGLFKADAVN